MGKTVEKAEGKKSKPRPKLPKRRDSGFVMPAPGEVGFAVVITGGAGQFIIGRFDGDGVPLLGGSFIINRRKTATVVERTVANRSQAGRQDD